MSNGLLNGLTEAWIPDATKALIGGVAGLDTNTQSNLSFISQPLFPGGNALQNGSGTGINLSTAGSVLLSEIGFTDFLFIYWSLAAHDATNVANVTIGENNNNGFNGGTSGSAGFPRILQWYWPGDDNMYSVVLDTTPAAPYAADTANMTAFWYLSDDILRTSVNNGMVYSVLNNSGNGNQDPTNYFNMFCGFSAGNVQIGEAYLWQGTAGVANALSQLALLFGGLPFSQFDSGGGNGSPTYARDVAIPSGVVQVSRDFRRGVPLMRSGGRSGRR